MSIRISPDLYHPKKENWEDLIGSIEFDNVSFKYKGTDKLVLENFNLQIKPGQMIAFVGETGSGKSTIINLISRFYEPTSGEIRIDNKDYNVPVVIINLILSLSTN